MFKVTDGTVVPTRIPAHPSTAGAKQTCSHASSHRLSRKARKDEGRALCDVGKTWQHVGLADTYTMGLGLNVSTDGGKTFRGVRSSGGDHHGLWIDPGNSNYLINVFDQGFAVSYDRGKSSPE